MLFPPTFNNNNYCGNADGYNCEVNYGFHIFASFHVLTKAWNENIISFARGGFPPLVSLEQINDCLNEIEHGGDKDDAFEGLVFIAVFLFPCHRFFSFPLGWLYYTTFGIICNSQNTQKYIVRFVYFYTFFGITHK